MQKTDKKDKEQVLEAEVLTNALTAFEQKKANQQCSSIENRGRRFLKIQSFRETESW